MTWMNLYINGHCLQTVAIVFIDNFICKINCNYVRNVTESWMVFGLGTVPGLANKTAPISCYKLRRDPFVCFNLATSPFTARGD